MCLCLFPTRPKKHRHSASSFEDPRPRKKRVTYQQIQSSSSSSQARYEPLHGHGVKHRSRPVASTSNAVLRGHGVRQERQAVTLEPVNGVLRGNGIKRDPPPKTLKGNGAKRTSSRRSSERPPVREQARRPPRQRDYSARPENVADAQEAYRQYYQQYYQQHYGLPHSTGQNPLRMAEVPRTSTDGAFSPNYFSYLDVCAVRAATNQALQATIYETTKPPRSSTRRDLRRRPAYSRLRC